MTTQTLNTTAPADGTCINPDLVRTPLPGNFTRQYKKHKIEHPEQKHGVRDIMLEQADHSTEGLCYMPAFI